MGAVAEYRNAINSTYPLSPYIEPFTEIDIDRVKERKNKQRKENELSPEYDKHEALVAIWLRKREPQNEFERTLLAEIREIEANGAEVEIPFEIQL